MISFWGYKVAQIINLPGWELFTLASCPFEVQCVTILGGINPFIHLLGYAPDLCSVTDIVTYSTFGGLRICAIGL